MTNNYAIIQKVEQTPELIEEFTGRIDCEGSGQEDSINIEINPKTREFYIVINIVDRKTRIVDQYFDIVVYLNRIRTFNISSATLIVDKSDEYKGIFRVTQDKLEYKKWDEVSELSVQVHKSRYYNPINHMNLSIINESRMSNHKRDFQIDETNDLKIKVIRTIKIRPKSVGSPKSFYEYDFGYALLNITPSFSTENALKNNTEWFSIYTDSENSESFVKYKLSSKPKYLANFLINNEYTNLSDMTQKINTKNWLEIGSHKSTKYDYKLKTTIESFGGKNGYVIPYNFSGVLTPTLNLDVDIFKNINVYYKIKIDKPLLDRYNGIIKLKTSESDEIENPYFAKDSYEIEKSEIDILNNSRIDLNLLMQKSTPVKKIPKKNKKEIKSEVVIINKEEDEQ